MDIVHKFWFEIIIVITFFYLFCMQTYIYLSHNSLSLQWEKERNTHMDTFMRNNNNNIHILLPSQVRSAFYCLWKINMHKCKEKKKKTKAKRKRQRKKGKKLLIWIVAAMRKERENEIINVWNACVGWFWEISPRRRLRHLTNIYSLGFYFRLLFPNYIEIVVQTHCEREFIKITS